MMTRLCAETVNEKDISNTKVMKRNRFVEFVAVNRGLDR